MSDGCFGIRKVVFFSLVLSLGWLGGCTDLGPVPREKDAGEDQDIDPATDEPDAGAPVPVLGPLEPGGWAQLDFDARKQFMRDVVVPAVRPLFQEFDPERFAAVSCKTCHGGGAQAGTFTMPSADLPVLDTESLKNPPEEQKPILAFMRE